MKIFLDNHSTTKIDPLVLEAMMPHLTDQYGNASSAHFFGTSTREVVENARAIVARCINAKPSQIYFTSGASESNNTIIKGLYHKQRLANQKRISGLITSPLEHASVLEAINWLSKIDSKVYKKLAVVNNLGQLDIENLDDLFGCNTLICSIQAANHEIGTINDLKEIGNKCDSNGIFFHTDATQAIGKIKIDVEDQYINALSFSAHKIHGPKGIGVLYLSDSNAIEPLIAGGLQEAIRSGTFNVPGIVGLAKAIELLETQDNKAIEDLRNLLLNLLQNEVPDLIVNGSLTNRLPNNLSVSIPGIKSEVFVKGITDLSVSSGSACKSGNDKPSDILMAINAQYPECAIRFGLSRFTTKEEIELAVQKIVEVVRGIRS